MTKAISARRDIILKIPVSISTLLMSACGNQPKFHGNPGGMLYLAGPSASFAADSWNVYIDKYKKNNNRVVIYAHGGSGLTQSDRSRVSMIKKFGFDVIYFDSFAMNSLEPRWANLNISDASKQDIIKNVFVGAYNYVNENPEYTDIVFYGMSNGGRAVISVLAKINPSPRLRLILSEGPASWGHEFPESVDIPVVIFYGERDNWGGRGEGDLMFHRKSPVTESSWQLKLSSAEWVDGQRRSGKPVSAIQYEGAGHDFHSGYFRAVARQMRMGSTTGYLGASAEALSKYEKDIREAIERYLPVMR